MFVFLSKLLAIPLNPVGLSLTLFALGLVSIYLLSKWWKAGRKVGTILIYCGAAAIFIFSLPLTSHLLMRGLEEQYSPSIDYGEADAVVFLGGATVGKIPPRIYVETNLNSNRVFHAVRVFRNTSASKLVLTGGLISFLGNDTVPEAYSTFELLNELFDIDTSDVIIESRARNTRENALYTKAALEENGLGTRIILVTNAYHMPRSVGIFKKANFEEITPAPTGYLEDEELCRKFMCMQPSSGALNNSAIALREYFGILVYKIMGWI